MLGIIIFQVLISIVIILVVHNLYLYFKDTLTTPKVKDLVNKPTLRYNDMYGIIQKNSYNNIKTNSTYDNNNNNSSNEVNNSVMKNELKNYMKNLINKKSMNQNNNNLNINDSNNINYTETNNNNNNNNNNLNIFEYEEDVNSLKNNENMMDEINGMNINSGMEGIEYSDF
jgi:hypothetical protein